MTESYLTTHPHVRRIIYGAAILGSLAALGLMFGWDNVLALGKQMLATAGLIEGTPK